MQSKRFGALSSSVDPQQMSHTIVSVVKLVAGVLVSVGLIATTGSDTLIEQAPVLVSGGYAAWQAIETIYGAVRKILVAFSTE